MNELLTIIVPAYNVENYIGECLNSLVCQTEQRHKIVIVNDGSTDHTEEVCLRFQKEYSDIITYVKQENRGLGEARNVGMSYADTPFLCFLDSDDWLNIKFVECFTKLIEETDEIPDMIFTLPWVYDSVTKCIRPWKDKELYEQIFEVQNGASRVQVNSRIKPELYALEVTSCRKIYRTSFLCEKKFSFPKGLKWEDVPGHFYLLHEANTCMALPNVGFFYRINQGGQITSGGGKTRLDMIPIFEQLLQMQDVYDFNQIERAYVLRLIIDFSIWSVDATNEEYIGQLLEGLHVFYQKFSKADIEYYLQNISKNRDYEKGFIESLIGDGYSALREYETRDRFISENANRAATPERKNLIKRGIQCSCEHGISYTIIWTIRKYLLKK